MPTTPTTTTTTTDPLLKPRTLMALHIASRDVKKHTSISIDIDHDPGELITALRLLSVLDKRLKCMAVIAARVVHDVSWVDIAERLGVSEDVARALHEPAVCRWTAGDPAPWGPILAARDKHVIEGLHPIDITAENIHDLAKELRP